MVMSEPFGKPGKSVNFNLFCSPDCTYAKLSNVQIIINFRIIIGMFNSYESMQIREICIYILRRIRTR